MSFKERVVVVDDHPLFRDRIVQIINHQTDLEVCGEAEDVPRAIEILQSTAPGLLIVDISLAGHERAGIDQAMSRAVDENPDSRALDAR